MDLSKIKVSLELKVLIGLILSVITYATNAARNEYKIEKNFIELKAEFYERLKESEYKQKDRDNDQDMEIMKLTHQQNIDRITNSQNKKNEQSN